MTVELMVLVVGGGDIARAVARAAGGSCMVRGPFPPTVAAAAGVEPDVVVADAGTPAGSRIVTDVRDVYPTVPILVARADDEDVVHALSLGACGIFDGRADDLRRGAAGEVVIPDDRLAGIVGRIGAARGAAGLDRLASLTAREHEVLRLVAEGVSTAGVAASLGISISTVQSHVKNVLAKLGVHSKVEAARVAWRAGVAAVPAAV